MNFFKQLQLTGIKNVHIEVKYAEDGTITVAVTPKSTATDAALKSIRPLLITGSVDEMDSEFFGTVSGSLSQTQQMFNNVENYEADKTEAEKNTQEQKDKADKLKKAEEALKKIVGAKEYKPGQDRKKVLKLAEDVLLIDPNNAAAKKAKNDALAQPAGSLFDMEGDDNTEDEETTADESEETEEEEEQEYEDEDESEEE